MIADEIVKLFPSESKVCWVLYNFESLLKYALWQSFFLTSPLFFQVVWIHVIRYPNGKTQLTGKLCNRYYNSRRRYSSIGLHDTEASDTEQVDGNYTLQCPLRWICVTLISSQCLNFLCHFTDTYSLDDDSNADLVYLRNNPVHSEKLVQAWKNTQDVRLQSVRKSSNKKKDQEDVPDRVVTYMKMFPVLFGEHGMSLVSRFSHFN